MRAVGTSGTSEASLCDSFSVTLILLQSIADVLRTAQSAFPNVPFSEALLRAQQERLIEAESLALAKTAESQDQLPPFEGTEPGAPMPGAPEGTETPEFDDTPPVEPLAPPEPGMPEAAHTLDWALAAACTAGVKEAIGEVEKSVLSEVPLYIRRIDASPSFCDELVQTLRERLFVAPAGGTARIGSYSGRGPLGGWIRIVSVRLALELKRKETVQPPENAADRLVDLALGPEDEVAKNEHTEAAQMALRFALKSLTARQRNLLRLRFAEGWSPEDLGKTYGVHRGTIARWVQEAREHVKVAMARELATILGFSEDEMPSVMRAVESRLELTFSMLKG